MKRILSYILPTPFPSHPLVSPSTYATVCKVLGQSSAFWLQKVCSFCEPCLSPQCCLHLCGWTTRKWLALGKYCIVSNPSGDSGLRLLFPMTCMMTASVSGPARAGGRHTMPTRNPSVCGIRSRAIGPPLMFANLGVIFTDHLGPNSYHSYSKAGNIPPGSNLHSTLLNIWSASS